MKKYKNEIIARGNYFNAIIMADVCSINLTLQCISRVFTCPVVPVSLLIRRRLLLDTEKSSIIQFNTFCHLYKSRLGYKWIMWITTVKLNAFWNIFLWVLYDHVIPKIKGNINIRISKNKCDIFEVYSIAGGILTVCWLIVQ